MNEEMAYYLMNNPDVEISVAIGWVMIFFGPFLYV